MSNSRALRRRLKASRDARLAAPRFPAAAPSVTTVRRHLRQLEADGIVEQTVEQTGKAGRPTHVWTLTEKGQRRVAEKNARGWPHKEAIKVHCPSCGAVPGTPCRTLRSHRTLTMMPHQSRMTAWQESARGPAPQAT